MRLVLLAAVFADAINLKGVAGREVVIFAADFLLQLADFLEKNSTELPQSVQTMW